MNLNLVNLDIVIPCYNPSENWSKVFVQSCNEIIKSLPTYDISFILVNDGSKKNIDAAQLKMIRSKITNLNYIYVNQNKGKGAAVRKGFEASKADFVLFTDIDFPYRTENLFSMVARLKQGADIVIGVRDAHYYKQIPAFRAKLSKFFKSLVKFLFNIPTTETQAGLKAFSAKGKQIVLQTTINRYLFDLELVKLASRQNLKFAYVPLSLKDGVVLSKMSFNVLLSESFNLIKILFK